jgi:hypothetical protein
MSLIRKRLAKKLFDADVIVKSVSELDLYKNRIGSVTCEAIKEGVILNCD